MSKILWCVGATLVLSAGVASAEVYMTVRSLASDLAKARANLEVNAAGGGSFADCREQLAKSKDQGGKPDEVIDHEAFEGMQKAFKDKRDRWAIHFADAGQICDELERIEPAARAVDFITETVRHTEGMRAAASDPSYLSAEGVGQARERVAECRASVAALVPIANAYKLTKIVLRTRDLQPVATIGDICDAMEKEIPAFQKLVEAQAAAAKVEWEKTLEPYRKAGAAGEKLQFLGSMDGTALYAVGGKELMSPKAKAAASVMFEVLTGNGVTVRRYTFKGNKSTGMSQKEYPVRPGASAFK